MKIIDVEAYQILDSRGNPTIETEVASKRQPWARFDARGGIDRPV
jgi:enolase